MRMFLRIFSMPFIGILLCAFMPASKAGVQTASITTNQADYPIGSNGYIIGGRFTSNTTKTTLI